MKRKIISAMCTILLLAAVLLFTGCGGSGSSSGNGETATISGSGN